MTEQNVDLVRVFSQVSRTLSNNQETLNQADTYNHDHGDHMVDTFKTITNAMKAKKGSNASDMLNYAAQKLSQNANNGSAQLYSQGLQKAAQQFQGQNVDTKSALSLLQTILSAGGQPAPQQPAQPSSGMGDLLGSLLGGSQTSSPQSSGMGDLLGSLLGGGQSTPQQGSQQTAAGGDLFGSLLGGLTGSSQQQSGGGLSDGLDMGDLVTAGMAYFQAKQQGKTNMNSLIEAFVAASGMGSSAHRQQSTSNRKNFHRINQKEKKCSAPDLRCAVLSVYGALHLVTFNKHHNSPKSMIINNPEVHCTLVYMSRLIFNRRVQCTSGGLMECVLFGD